MKRPLSILLPLLALAAACSGDATSPVSQRGPAAARAAASGDYIVVLREDANPRAVAALLGIKPSRVYEHAITGFSATLDEGKLTALRRLPAVAYVEPDAPVR